MSNKRYKHFILNSTELIEECTDEKYWDWHERLREADQTVLGVRIKHCRIYLWNGECMEISTVFTGDDSGGYCEKTKKPFLFETIVYDPTYQFNMSFRFVSHKEAVDHHKKIANKLNKKYSVYH